LNLEQNGIETVLTERDLQRKFDVVSMQFCMHYAFKTPASARIMLENVASQLRYGGMFIGTIPDAELLVCVAAF
jgi:mRNA (guanine-N7-)-methyltransferase